MKYKSAQLSGLIFMFLGVALGALSSHALKSVLSPEQLGGFIIGVEYMIYHGLALLALSSWNFKSEKGIKNAFRCMIAGQILFSGSIFLLSTKSLHHMPIGILGPLTPIGGLFLLLAWGILIWKVVTEKIISEQ